MKNKEKEEPKQSVEEIAGVINSGKYATAYWVENSDVEAKIKEDTGATIRCLIDAPEGTCIHSGEKTTKLAIIARAY